MKNNEKKIGGDQLGREPIGRLLFRLAIPSIIAQVINILYNIVDRIYIGRMENGTIAMSAIAISLPIVTFITAVTQLFGTGGAPLAAIRLGKKNKAGAEKILTNSFVMLILSGFILTLLIEVFHIPLLKVFGADQTNLEMAAQYITIYGMGTVFVQIAFGMNTYINTQGYAMYGMITVLLGALLNIVLDPLFIFVFDMGVSGAAWATILSQLVSAIWALVFLFGKKSTIRIRREYLFPKWNILCAICALGASPFIMSSTESFLQIAFNNQLSLYGGTLAVGTMSILQSIFHMISMPLIGLTQGAQPITSFNYGAKNMERVKKTFRLLFRSCLGISLFGFGIVILFSNQLVRIFTNDRQMILLAGWALRIYVIGALLFGAQIACQQSFVALGQARQSLIMALYRKVFLLIPLIHFLPAIMGESSFAMHMSIPVANILKDEGRVFCVLLAESIADAVAAVTTTLLFFAFYRKALNKREK